LTTEILDSLQAVKIFMDWNTTNGAAVYHPSVQWLTNNGYIPEKAKSVEISNVVNFVNWSNQNQPSMVIHEMAHAYHDRVLGFDYNPIIKAFENAITFELYNSVSYHAGNDVYFNQQAYATTNELEYFAELTEAYLGENDFFPFFRDQIEDHDEEGYKVVRDVWQFGTTSTSEEALSAPIRVFPNPVSDQLNIQLNSQNSDIFLQVIATDGKLLKTMEVDAQDNISIDVSDLVSGVYMLRAGKYSCRFIKK
ncbi:MAG: T9SS type A sorting domain-containing protein, partial [Bacteroidota bacterium]